MLNPFTQHPASMNQTYFVHMKFALCFGSKMVFGGLACILHALFPFIFKATGSQTAFNSVETYLHKLSDKNMNEQQLLQCILDRKEKLNPNSLESKN